VLTSLILVAAVANLNLSVANVAQPSIGKAFNASQVALDLVAVGFSLGLATSMLWFGTLGDRYERKRMLVIGTTLAMAVSLLVAALILAINFAHRPNVGTLVLGLSAIALAFYMRQRRAKNPLYDLHFVGRRTFWVAAGAGIIVFGSLMGALFIGQQYLQNLQGYSTFEAGLSILPAPFFMVLVVPQSTRLVEARGACFTLLLGFVFCLLGFQTMLLLWKQGSPYWEVGLDYALVGIGIGFAGTPASSSLTGSVPVQRPGIASETADLQRDLGGAIMQSIFGALLTAGYAKIMAAAVAANVYGWQVTSSTEAELQKSFAGAALVAQQYPKYASQITAAAKASFLAGDHEDGLTGSLNNAAWTEVINPYSGSPIISTIRGFPS
jgi:MFS transporter, DHA2 family, multidrug resistance protein